MHKIMLIILVFFLAPICESLCFAGNFADKIVEPPKKMYHDSKTFLYNKAWKNKEAYVEANLDKDADKEIVISFMTTHKPKDETEEDDDSKHYYTRKKKAISPVQNIAFYQIYDKRPDGYFEAVKTVSGTDRLGLIFLIKLRPDMPEGLAILSPYGEHSISLEILLWKQGGYSLIFSELSRIENNDLGSIKKRIIFGSKYIWDPEKNIIELTENRESHPLL